MNLSLLKPLWHLISNRHVEENMDELQVVRVRLMNRYTFFISLILLLDAFWNLLLWQTLNFSVLLAIGGILFLLTWYSRIYFSTQISVSALIGMTLLVFYFCSTTGFHSGIAPYYFGILFAVLFIFSERNKLYNMFVFLWIFILFYMVQLFGLDWFAVGWGNRVCFHKSQHTTLIQFVVLLAVNGYFIMLKNNELYNLVHQILLDNTPRFNLQDQLSYGEQSQSVEEIVKLAKEDNMAFIPMFKHAFPDFYEKLLRENPEMTREEFKFCALLKLGFTTKDIANYRHMEVRSVQTKKSRLRKSFSVPPNEDLYMWIDQF